MELFSLLLPEVLLIATALVLFMFGVVKSPAGRKVAPWLALVGLLAALVTAILQVDEAGSARLDWTGAILTNAFSSYVKILVASIGLFFVLLSWPTNEDATGNPALRFGADAGEFFGLILLSLAGIMLVGSANDTILLFMGIELASIPTYVLVSISRPLPAAQEAGVKYFYLGAMTAAIMLLGFAYLYGATGTTNMLDMGRVFAGEMPGLGMTDPDQNVFSPTTWQVLGVILVLLGFGFKLAAVPLHFYAGDVYTGAATPVTALLSFVPKAVGILATLKILYAVGGNAFYLAPAVWKVLFAVAVLTMTFGNVLALLADNLKRVMAYSSIAHSGYMLVALTVLAAYASLGPRVEASALRPEGLLQANIEESAIVGVLFYLTAYGVMNAGVFGVLMMLPTRQRVTDRAGNLRRLPATSAETYDDIAGAARRHPILTAAMAICCISLIGIPLTVGFLGKFYVIRPALSLAGFDNLPESSQTAMYWLIGLTLLNAAIGAAYYLRIIASMVLSPSIEEEDALAEGQAYEPPPAPRQPWPLQLATGLSVAGVLILGFITPGIEQVNRGAIEASTALTQSVRQIAITATRPDATVAPAAPAFQARQLEAVEE